MSRKVLKDVTNQKGQCFTCKKFKSVYDFYWSGKSHEPIGFFFARDCKSCLKEKQKLRCSKQKENLIAQNNLPNKFKPLITIYVASSVLCGVKLEDEHSEFKFESVKVNLIDDDTNEELGVEDGELTAQESFYWWD